MHEQKTQAAGQEQHQTSNATPSTAWQRQGITVTRQRLATQAHAAPKPNPRPGAPGPRLAPPATVPQRPVAPKLLPRLNPTRNAGDGPCRPPPTTPPTSNPLLVTPWRFQGAQAAPGTWEKESATYWEGIGSSSPERAVSPSISSPTSSIGEDIGAATGLWERIRGRRNETRKHSGS
jgi:hypothetical protein